MQEEIDQIINVQKRIRTNEDWYPNYTDNLIEVSLALINAGSIYRVCVWGADDFGMEKDFCFINLLEAMIEYMSITDGITKQELFDKGFDIA